ncbi:hypothetical protein D3C81_1016360 [compost metagenome]
MAILFNCTKFIFLPISFNAFFTSLKDPIPVSVLSCIRYIFFAFGTILSAASIVPLGSILSNIPVMLSCPFIICLATSSYTPEKITGTSLNSSFLLLITNSSAESSVVIISSISILPYLYFISSLNNSTLRSSG